MPTMPVALLLLLAGPATATASAACACTPAPVKGLALVAASSKCATFLVDHSTGHILSSAAAAGAGEPLCLGPAGDGSVRSQAILRCFGVDM